MRNYSKFLLIALVIAIVLPSCKKYEEGPAVSLRSKKARLVYTWQVVQVLKDGVDITTSYQTNRPNLVVEFKENGDLTQTYTNPNDSTVVATSKWEFNKGKSGVNITAYGVTVLATILKLKNDELWTKTSLTNIEEIHYITK
jgi:hypothetical protein